MDYHEIGQRIAKARKDKGYTQEKLAELLFVTHATISQWETGKRGISYENITKISQLLNVDEEYLLGRTYHRTYNSGMGSFKVAKVYDLSKLYHPSVSWISIVLGLCVGVSLFLPLEGQHYSVFILVMLAILYVINVFLRLWRIQNRHFEEIGYGLQQDLFYVTQASSQAIKKFHWEHIFSLIFLETVSIYIYAIFYTVIHQTFPDQSGDLIFIFLIILWVYHLFVIIFFMQEGRPKSKHQFKVFNGPQKILFLSYLTWGYGLAFIGVHLIFFTFGKDFFGAQIYWVLSVFSFLIWTFAHIILLNFLRFYKQYQISIEDKPLNS